MPRRQSWRAQGGKRTDLDSPFQSDEHRFSGQKLQKRLWVHRLNLRGVRQPPRARRSDPATQRLTDILVEAKPRRRGPRKRQLCSFVSAYATLATPWPPLRTTSRCPKRPSTSSSKVAPARSRKSRVHSRILAAPHRTPPRRLRLRQGHERPPRDLLQRSARPFRSIYPNSLATIQLRIHSRHRF